MKKDIYYKMTITFKHKELNQMGNWRKIFEEQGMVVDIVMIETPKTPKKENPVDADILYQYDAGV